MKKRIRMGFLMLAGALVYFAAAEKAGAWCVPECWDNGYWTCCTNERCIDYCF